MLSNNHEKNTKYYPPYLATCPMCSGVPEFEILDDIYGIRARIICPSCGVVLLSDAKNGTDWMQKLVAQWNTRSLRLAPCPLCDGAAFLDDWEKGYESGTTIKCKKCGLMVCEGVENGDDWRNRAIQKWNSRSFSDIRKYIK